jgi:G protein beta subunit-like protein
MGQNRVQNTLSSKKLFMLFTSINDYKTSNEFSIARAVIVLSSIPMHSSLLLSASYATKSPIIAFDLAKGTERCSFDFQSSQVNRLLTLPRQSIFYAAGRSSFLVYDIRKPQRVIKSISAHSTNVTDMDSHESLFVTSGEDCLLKAWDSRTFSESVCLRTPAPINAIRFLADGTAIASADEAGFVSIHDLRAPATLVRMQMSDAPARTLAIAPNLERIFVAGHDGQIACFTFADKKLAEVYRVTPAPDVQTRITVSPDEKWFAVAGAGGAARLGNVENGAIEKTFAVGQPWTWVWDAAFTSDSERIVVGGSDGVCRLLSCRTGTVQKTFPPAEKCVNCVALLSQK